MLPLLNPKNQPKDDYLKHDMFYFTSSGSEAMENAVKIARMGTNRPNVIALHKGFHGRLFGTMAWSSSKTGYKAGFQPMMGGVFFCDLLTPEG